MRRAILLLTLLLAVQGEFVSARVRVVCTGVRVEGAEGCCHAVRPAADGRAVVSYDARLNDTVAVAERSSDELAARYGVERLGDLLRRPHGRTLYLELRDGDEAFAREVLREVRAAGYAERVCFLAADAALCRLLQEALPRRTVYYMADRPETLKEVRGVALHCSRLCDRQTVRRLRRGGHRVMAWDVNAAEDWEAVCACGVKELLVDDPELAAERLR